MPIQKTNRTIKAQIKRKATYSAAANFLLDDDGYLILNQYKTLKKVAKTNPNSLALRFSNPIEARENDTVSQLLNEIEDLIKSYRKFADWAINLSMVK